MDDWSLRQSEPYHFQRDRRQLSDYPRPAQPNTSQPNQLPAPAGWGMGTGEYWNLVFKEYLNRRKAGASITNLALGR